MSLARRVGLSLLSFWFPGVGHGALGQRRWMVAWASFGVLSMLAVLGSVWTTWLHVVLRVGCVVDTFIRIGRASSIAAPGDPVVAEAVAGKPRGRLSNRALTVVALVIGAIGLSTVRLAVEAFKIPSSSMYPTLEIGDHIYADKLTIRWRPPGRGDLIVFHHPCQAKRDFISRVIAVGGDTVEVRCSVVHVNGRAVPSTLIDADGCSYDDRDAYRGERIAHRCSRYREVVGDRRYDVFHDQERPSRDQRRTPAEPGMGDRSDFPLLDSDRPSSCASSYTEASSRADSLQAQGALVMTKSNATDPCESQLHYVVPERHLFVMGDNRSNSNDSRYWGSVPEELVVGRAIGVWYPFGRIGSID